MKICSYCGLGNDDAATCCAGCSTEFKPPAPVDPGLTDAAGSLVVLASFGDAIQASVLKDRLEQAGIAACIPEELEPGLFGNFPPLARVTVRVAEKDLPAAREILGINSGITTETIPVRVAGEVPAEPGQAAEAPPPPLLGSPVFERTDWLSFAITMVLALAIYLFTLAPDVTLEMSGELATAALYGGVAHPPGFPVWTIYAWLFTKLLPWSNIAWRIGVSSAVAAALTCGVVALMVSRVGAIMLEGMKGFRRLEAKEERLLRLVCGYVAGMAFGFSGSAWEVAVAVDHRALETLLFCMVVCTLVRWSYEPSRKGYLYAAFFLYGLTISTSQVMIPAAVGLPFFVMFGNQKLGRDLLFASAVLSVGVLMANYWDALPPIFDKASPVRGIYLGIACLTGATCVGLIIKTRGFLTEWRPAVVAGLACLAGLAPHVCLPLASMTNPPMNWGYAREIGGFFHVITRGQYEHLNPTENLGNLIRQLCMYGGIAVTQFGAVYLLVALVPFWFLRRMQAHDRRMMLGLVVIFLCMSVFMLILLNPPPDRAAQELLEQYFLASYLMPALWTGFGLLLLGTLLARRSKAP